MSILYPIALIVESIEISSFDNGIWIYDKKNKYYLNSLTLLKYIPQIKYIDLMDSAYPSIAPAPTSIPNQEIADSLTTYISVSCHITSDVLDVEELIKIAESIN